MDLREAPIRRYFDACNAAGHAALVSCLTPDAVHCFPPGLPGISWRDVVAIAAEWVWCVENLGSRWTIEKVLLAEDSAPEAAIEWTHWKTGSGTAQRGDEWYRFGPASGLISEIRVYYAAPAVQDVPVGEPVGFDYRGRGYRLEPPR